MSKRLVVESPEVISEIECQLIHELGKARIIPVTVNGEPGLAIDERKRPKCFMDVNWRALKVDRPFPADADVFLAQTSFGFVIYPAMDWQEIVEYRIHAEGTAQCLRDALIETHRREHRLANLVGLAEEALLRGEWDKVDWNDLFQSRAEFKACDLDKMVPTKAVDALLDSAEWPVAGLCITEARSLLHFPRSSESELVAMEFDDIVVGASLAANARETDEAVSLAIHYKKKILTRAEWERSSPEEAYSATGFRSSYGNADLAMYKVTTDRMRGLDRRLQRAAFVLSLAPMIKSTLNCIDTMTLLDFPGEAADFNERNNHWNRRFLGCINRVADILSVDAGEVDSVYLDNAVRERAHLFS